MKPRSVPAISPNDLRDHADEKRIGRIWERLEHDLAGVEAPKRRGRGIALTLLAATLAAFGVGVVAGRVVWHEPTPVAVPTTPASDRPHVEVFAAGSQAAVFALPGGGEIALKPGATVEIVRGQGGDALTVRLVQGEARVDAAPRTADVALIAGDARLSSAAGSVVVVRRGANHMDVEVASGSVAVSSPIGAQRLEAGQPALEIPLHTITTAVTPPVVRRDRAAPSSSADDRDPPAEAPIAAVAVAAAPDWRARYKAGEDKEALELLKAQPGGIEGAIHAAKSASELMQISEVARWRGADTHSATRALATRALEKVVERFPNDPNASVAAMHLSKMYDKAAKAGDVGAQAKAEMYKERAKQLAPQGALGVDVEMCKQFMAAHRDGRKDEAAKLAQEYVTKYPNGPCRDDADRIRKGEELPSDEESAPNANDPKPPADPKP